MASFDFPASPANGAVYSLNGVSYVWNGYAWTQGDNIGVPYLPLAGGTMSGDLTISKANPALILNKTTVAENTIIRGQVAGVNRWAVLLGTAVPETGGNLGSDFQINRYSDAGTFIDTPLSITRKTGDAVFSSSINAGGLITATSVLGVKSTLPNTNNAHLFFYDNDGTERALIYAQSDGSLLFRYAKQARSLSLSANGGAYFGAGAAMYLDMYNPTTANGGFRCKHGVNNVIGTNWFNFWWDGTFHAMVDKTYLGVVAFTSDYRIKKDVAPLGSTWDIVKALNPISYTQAEYSPDSHLERMAEPVSKDEPALGPFFPADDKERWGFIAHELQETLIEDAATAYKDAPDAVQSPNPWTIIAALTKTVQEMQDRIEALEAASGV